MALCRSQHFKLKACSMVIAVATTDPHELSIERVSHASRAEMRLEIGAHVPVTEKRPNASHLPCSLLMIMIALIVYARY